MQITDVYGRIRDHVFNIKFAKEIETVVKERYKESSL